MGRGSRSFFPTAATLVATLLLVTSFISDAGGTLAPCKNLPIGFANKCAGYSCDAVTGAAVEYGCINSHHECEDGLLIRMPIDSMKKFPDCCAKFFCLRSDGTIDA